MILFPTVDHCSELIMLWQKIQCCSFPGEENVSSRADDRLNLVVLSLSTGKSRKRTAILNPICQLKILQ
uniref:Uncharacterized protein n=1 Tax=Pararge aegeria TaxID=116150 RepID=S4P203_9NEOP